MRRHCNLELGLFPPYDSGTPKQEERQSQQRQITIFYDGKICVSDVTELQAKSILMLANKKANIIRTPTTTTTATTGSSSSSEPSSSPPPPPLLMQQQSNNNYNNNNNNNNQQLYNTTAGTGLSMKRSLQRFLQKRKNRSQEASPYHHH